MLLRMPLIPSSIAILINFTIFVITTIQLFLVVLLARNWLTLAGVELDVTLKVNLQTKFGLLKLWRVVDLFPAMVKNLHTSVNKNNLVH